MRHSERTLFRWIPIQLFACALLAVALVALAACGDDDDGDASASPTASNEASESPSASPNRTPDGTPGGPVECSGDDAVIGLLARLVLSGDNGIYEPGEQIDFTFTLINCGDNDTVLNFPTSQRNRFLVERLQGGETGATVWSSEDDAVFQQVEGTETIEPGQTVVYSASWDQTDRDGIQVEDGMYKISAFSVGCAQVTQTNCQFGSVSQFEIREGSGPSATDEPTETAEPTETEEATG